VRALAFDIQGTAVDFFEPVMRMGAALNARKALAIDWAALSARWRALYRDGMDAVIAGRQPWRRVDAIYREALDGLLAEQGVADRFTPAERDEINTVWTRLDPWPDSVAGLTRLRRKFTVAGLSNAGMAAAIAVVKHAGLPFDAVLTAELARAYKPDPATYRLAVDYLGFPPHEIMMVACHKYDLHGAKAVGFRTAFVARPREFGPDATPDVSPDAAFDINARDFLDLADQLGA
jgi:2-haloacid dehalogenase